MPPLEHHKAGRGRGSFAAPRQPATLAKAARGSVRCRLCWERFADDFTGATDLCNTLVRPRHEDRAADRRPAPGAGVPDAEAVVIALKSRRSRSADAWSTSPQGGWPGCGKPARGRSSSNTARPSIRPTRAISGRWPRAARRARSDFHALLPGLPRGGPHDLQGLPLRRRCAAVRIGHARPPADPSATLAGPRAAAPEPRRGRAGQHTVVAQGPAAIADAFARLRGRRLPPRDRRCDRRPRPRGDRPGPAAEFRADHRAGGDRARPCRRISAAGA